MNPTVSNTEMPIAGDILIVDDTPDNLRLLSEMLVKQGYQVRTAPDGSLALASAQAIPPDLILLDIKMPGLSGYEVCEQLKADPRTRAIPIIFISALDQAEDKVKAFELGGVDYVTKPFRTVEVLARVETHLSLNAMRLRLEEQNQELRESEEKYRSLTTNLPVGVYRTSVEGQILFANPAVVQMLGYDSIEDLQTSTAMDIYVDPIEREQQLESWRMQGGIIKQEITLQRKDGSLIWVRDIGQVILDEDGEVAYIEGILEDITARKLAEKKAYEAETRYRALFEQNNDVVIITNLDAIIVDANPQLVEMFNIEREQVIGKHVEDFFASNVLEAMVSRGAALRAGKEVPIFESQIAHPDGSVIPVEISTSLVYDADGNPTHIHGILRDITARKQAEAEREQLIADLEAYAHTVAHDLKSPASLQVGFSDILLMGGLSEEEQQASVQAISDGAYKMVRIVDELLLLASVRHIEDIAVDTLDMGVVVSAAQERLTRQLEESQAEVKLPDKWPAAVGYAPWVEEIWANYISNAIKYGGEPPRVELGADIQPDGMVCFWVRDNGEGLTEEEVAQLFTKFSRLDQARATGHGLGLSIVKRIAERLNGQVGVESTPGQGSVFSFTLPMAV